MCLSSPTIGIPSHSARPALSLFNEPCLSVVAGRFSITSAILRHVGLSRVIHTETATTTTTTTRTNKNEGTYTRQRTSALSPLLFFFAVFVSLISSRHLFRPLWCCTLLSSRVCRACLLGYDASRHCTFFAFDVFRLSSLSLSPSALPLLVCMVRGFPCVLLSVGIVSARLLLPLSLCVWRCPLGHAPALAAMKVVLFFSPLLPFSCSCLSSLADGTAGTKLKHNRKKTC